MRAIARIALIVCILAASLTGLASAAVIQNGQGGGEGDARSPGSSMGSPVRDFFPNHDPEYTIINLTNNTYEDGQPFPIGYYMKYATFNSTGTRIAVAARNRIDEIPQNYEIWAMDYDDVTQTISNFQQITNTGGTGDIDSNDYPSFSRTDPDLLLFCEVHVVGANLLKTYDFGTVTFTTVYDPANDPNGYDVTNPGFLGTSDTDFILGVGYATGNDRIVAFDGTYPSTTISSPDQNLDPSSNHAGSRVTYYSTNATYTLGSIYSEFDGANWSENADGFGDPTGGNVPGYWAYYSGKDDDKILSIRSDLGWDPTGLGLYDSNGVLVSDLLGDGGTDFTEAYANNNWEGPNGEILFRAEEYTHLGYGNDIFIAYDPPFTVYVDDDWTGPENCGGHEWGVDAFAVINDALTIVTSGDVIDVAEGSYEEQLTVDGISITIIGAGKGLTNILSPPALDLTFTTSNDHYCIVGIINHGHLDISGATVDGQYYGNANYRFCGIGIRNSSASITDCEILNIMDTPFSGAQHGVGIYAYCDDDTPQQIDVIDCEVLDFQKNGLALSGADVTATVQGVTTIGQGQTDVTAQNGIQLGYAANGVVDGCTVADVCWIGETWTASGILLYDAATVDVLNCSVTDCQTGVYYIATKGTYDNNTLTAGINSHSQDERYWGLTIDEQGPHGPPGYPFGDGEREPGRASSKVKVTNSTFTADRTGEGIGIGAWAVFHDKAVVDILECDILNWAIGIDVWDDGTALPTVDVRLCNIMGNTQYGILNATTKLVTAEHNWWGSSSGPYNPVTNPFGLGDTVSDNVDFDPWLDNNNPYLFFTGTPTQGATITFTVIGLPGQPVILALSNGIKDPPYSTPYGDLYLLKPLSNTFNIGYTDTEGWLDFTATLPTAWGPGKQKPFQSLVGERGNPVARLTNYIIITIE